MLIKIAQKNTTQTQTQTQKKNSSSVQSTIVLFLSLDITSVVRLWLAGANIEESDEIVCLGLLRFPNIQKVFQEQIGCQASQFYRGDEDIYSNHASNNNGGILKKMPFSVFPIPPRLLKGD